MDEHDLFNMINWPPFTVLKNVILKVANVKQPEGK